MVKVIVADDEVRICRLIIKLIDWNNLGLCLVGTANNGMEALALAEQEKPDIIITDIRMPGCDGLEMIEKIRMIKHDVEFIIISGYGEFEYAKRAMALGVQEYLLKPINQNELRTSLLKVTTCIQKKNNQIDLARDYETILKDDACKTRQIFLNDLLFLKGRSYYDHLISEINEIYRFHFQEGSFNVACIRVDQETDNALFKLQDTMDYLTERWMETVTGCIHETEVVRKQHNLYAVMNFSSEQEKNLQEALKEMLRAINQETGRRNGLVVTIAIGEKKSTLGGLVESLESANQLVEDRILVGCGGLMVPSDQQMDRVAVDHLYQGFSQKITQCVEHLDIEGITKAVDGFHHDMAQQSVRGAYLKQLIRETVQVYHMIMKNSHSQLSISRESENDFTLRLELACSMDEVFDTLAFHLTDAIRRYIEDESRSGSKFIREAKKYIEENYMKPLTLEDIGAHVGFNPSYFSSVFKKETGTSFVEYLSKTRIEKAKVLLKESDLRVLDISFMVGYNDVKYFTKSFKKHTGLQPNEYRKIFS